MQIEILTIEEAAEQDEAFCRIHFPERMKRASTFRMSEDRLRCIGAGLLIHRVFGVEEEEICLNSYGKPYLRDNGRCFSISHSGRYIVLAVGDAQMKAIGVDIERKKDRSMDAKKIFLEDELEWLAEDPVSRFYQIWTMKESVIKADGRGLSMPMDFSVLPILEGSELRHEDRIYHGISINLLSDYCLSAVWH